MVILFWWLLLSGRILAEERGDLGSIPGSGRSCGVGNGNPLQYSCLGNPMDRGAWRAIVHGIARVRHDLMTKPATTPTRRGEREWLVNGMGFIWGDENILELERGGCCTMLWMLLNATELFVLKWLISCYLNFTGIKKKKTWFPQQSRCKRSYWQRSTGDRQLGLDWELRVPHDQTFKKQKAQLPSGFCFRERGSPHFSPQELTC